MFRPISDKELSYVRKLKGEVAASFVAPKLKVTVRRAHKILLRAGFKIVKQGGHGAKTLYRLAKAKK